MVTKRFIVSLGLLVILASTNLCQEPNLPPAMASLVETEKAFAATCVEKGAREAFYLFFADDAVNYQLFPERKKRPVTGIRPPTTVNWTTTYGDVSRAGDLGYNVGPLLVTDHGPKQLPPQHGLIFSIWKKQADGTWKVVLDAGVKTPAAVADLNAPFQFARQRKVRVSSTNLEAGRSKLLAADRELLSVSQGSVANAFRKYLSDDARVHRNNIMPLVGKHAIRSYLSSKSLTMSGEPMGSDVAKSADLGYTYGTYKLTDRTTGGVVVEEGLYVRVWKRGGDNQWKVVLDTTAPSPPGKAMRRVDGIWKVVDTATPQTK